MHICYAVVRFAMRGYTLLFLAFRLIAQTPGGDNSITGRVINSRTGEPIKNALVSVTKIPGPEEIRAHRLPAPPTPTEIMTGFGGEFQIGNLRTGEYMINVRKPGWQEEQPQKHCSERGLKVSSVVSGVEIKLALLGVIEGRVQNQYGEPMQRVSIRAVQILVRDGFRQTYGEYTAVTDDRGVYRMANFPPGKYFVKASGRAGGTNRFFGNGSPSYASSWESFAPIYSNGGHDLASATPVVEASR